MSRLNEVSKEAWAEWLDHPVTKSFRTLLLKRREDLKEQWAEGAFTHPEDAGNDLAQGRAIGGAQLLADLLQLDAETVTKELSDDEDDGKPIGAAAAGPSGPGGAL